MVAAIVRSWVTWAPGLGQARWVGNGRLERPNVSAVRGVPEGRVCSPTGSKSENIDLFGIGWVYGDARFAVARPVGILEILVRIADDNIPDQDAVRQPADPKDLRWQGQLTPRNRVLGKSFADVLMEVGREVTDLVFSLPHRKRQA